jgi:osmotically-inducible protein OsmY
VDTGQLEVRDHTDGAGTGTTLRRPSDREIERALRQALRHDGRVVDRGIGIRCAGVEVTLTGRVVALRARRAALQDAVNTVGVLRVHDKLRVTPAPGGGDARLARRVRHALEENPDLERYDLGVTVFDGQAHLSGIVASHFDRQLAERLAAAIPGLEALRNNIVTNRTRPIESDWQLLADVHSELFWSPVVSSDQVTVAVDHGVVTLTGQVESWSERQAAAQNAREAGARRVRNKLELASWGYNRR